MESLTSLLERLEKQIDRLERKNTARQLILANLPFYPAYPPPELLRLGLTNEYVRRLCDGMAANGKLEKHWEDGYNSEKGRENGLVFYVLNSKGES